MTFEQEKRAWWTLVGASLMIRIIGLGIRAMSHDESLHALYSWYLVVNGEYQHDPMMHGPLLFHLNALAYLVFFGASDFSARIVPALMGTGCVAMLWLYRPWLGRGGAFAAACLVSVTPSLLYHSRYIRNDIYICLFTLMMVWAVLRYVESRQPRFLYWLASALALSFACKEVCFIHGTVLGAFCVGMLLRDRYLQVDSLPLSQNPWFHCALTILTLALPFALPLAHQVLGWDPMDSTSRTGQLRTAGLFVLFNGVASSLAIAGLGKTFFPRKFEPGLKTWLIAFAIFWSIELLLYTTFFTNTAKGFCTGLAGSLGYWLAQHEVERGSPDRLFYVGLILLYEPAILLMGIRSCFQPRAFAKRLPVRGILLTWFIGHFLIYSWAGERMPWLMTHISLPLCLLAGPSVARLFATCHRFRLQHAIGFALLLHVLINSVRVNGPLAESAREPMVYAHAGPDVKQALERIHQHLHTDENAFVAIHEEFSWPLAWYVRSSGNVTYYADPENLPLGTTMLIADEVTANLLNTHAVWRREGITTMIHWPLQSWHNVNRQNLKGLWSDKLVRRQLRDFYLHRQYPGLHEDNWPLRHDFQILVRQETPEEVLP